MTAQRTSGSPSLVELPLAARYAIEALAWMSIAPPEAYQRVEDVAVRLGLPAPFLGKILRRLGARGLLEARRGPSGGFRLAHSSEEVGVLAIADASAPDGGKPRSCALFPRPCGGHPCAAHEGVQGAESELRRTLSRLSLAELARQLERDFHDPDGGIPRGLTLPRL